MAISGTGGSVTVCGNGGSSMAVCGNGVSVAGSLPLCALLALAALFSGGCALTLSPPEHRAQQYSNAFNTYDAQTKERLRAATIAPGDDRTAVYIALGNPQRRRIGYDREPQTGEMLVLEFWDYSGYPTGKREGQFMTLSNGGFASPLGTRPYGKATVEFSDGLVRRYSHDPEQNVPDRSGRQMALPPEPHRRTQ